MIRNFLLTAQRHFRRYTFYCLINIAGLALGLACCVLLTLYIQYEFSFDRFHAKLHRIHLVNLRVAGPGYNRIQWSTSPLAAEALRSEFPEVEQAVRFRAAGRIPVRHGDHQFYETGIMYADAALFEVFTFPLIAGDPRQALVEPYSVVISRRTAERYFGDADPLGETLRFNDSNDFTVTGVMEG